VELVNYIVEGANTRPRLLRKLEIALSASAALSLTHGMANRRCTPYFGVCLNGDGGGGCLCFDQEGTPVWVLFSGCMMTVGQMQTPH
jgi:hypothetical protein